MPDFYDDVYYATDARQIPQATTDAEVALLADLIGDRDAEVLDLGCGDGRHLKGLIAAGFTNIYGLDQSATALQRLASALPEDSRDQLFLGDFTEAIPAGRSFDAIYSMYSSLLHGADCDLRFLFEILAGTLRPQGLLVIEYLDHDEVRALLQAPRRPGIKQVRAGIKRIKAAAGRLGAEMYYGYATIEGDLLIQRRIAWRQHRREVHTVTLRLVSESVLNSYATAAGFQPASARSSLHTKQLRLIAFHKR